MVSIGIEKNLDIQRNSKTQKIPVLNLWMNWKNLCRSLTLRVCTVFLKRIDNMEIILLYWFTA